MKKVIKILLIVFALICTLDFTSAYFTTSKSINNTFKARKYNIVLNGNGGTYSKNNITVLKNKTTLPSPSRNGYTFSGYSTSSTGSVNYSSTINDVNAINNKTIYAKWSINNYSITYNLNGGSLSGQKTSYTVEDTFTLSNPIRTGYAFAGWTGSNGSTKQTSVTVPKGSTGNKSYTANWNINKYVVDINPIIQNVTYNSGLSGFTFSVWLNGNLVAQNVTDYYNDSIDYGTKIRVYVNDRDGYNITSFRDYTWTVTSSFNINPSWYDNIPPTIVSFSVTNLGYHDPSNIRKGWDIRVYVNAYDNGTGIQKYQTWLAPYGNGSGAEREDGNDRTLYNVLYLNTASGRTFCAYAIDNAGNESSMCDTIKVN